MLSLVEKRRATDDWHAIYEMHRWDTKELEDEETLEWDGETRSWRPSGFADLPARAPSG
jgi:hypothetical protein